MTKKNRVSRTCVLLFLNYWLEIIFKLQNRELEFDLTGQNIRFIYARYSTYPWNLNFMSKTIWSTDWHKQSNITPLKRSGAYLNNHFPTSPHSPRFFFIAVFQPKWYSLSSLTESYSTTIPLWTSLWLFYSQNTAAHSRLDHSLTH